MSHQGPVSFAKREQKISWIVLALAAIAVVAVLHVICYYIGYNTVDEKEYITRPVVLGQTPEKIKTRGHKKDRYFIKFPSYDQDHTWVLDKEYYSYSLSANTIYSLKRGDTILALISPVDTLCLQNPYDKHYIRMVNFVRNKAPYIDHNYRNKLVNKKNKDNMILWLCALVVAVVAFLCAWLWFRRRR